MADISCWERVKPVLKDINLVLTLLIIQNGGQTIVKIVGWLSIENNTQYFYVIKL